MFKQREEIEFTEEENGMIRQICEQPLFSIMETSKAVLFTTIGSKSNINRENEFRFSEKIKRDVYVLMKSGYTTFVASRGNSYGMLALESMIQLKSQWVKDNRSFTILAVKLYGEAQEGKPQAFMEDQRAFAYQCVQNGVEMRNLFPLELIDLLKQIPAISHENGMILTHAKTKKNAEKVAQLVEYLLSLNARNTRNL